jgi:hypothetical protein
MNNLKINRWISMNIFVQLIAIISLLFFFSGFAAAQRDVMTLKRKGEIYLGQWYVSEDLPNILFIVNLPNEANIELLQLLSQEDLNLEDGNLHPDTGALHFISYTALGFQKTIVRIETDDTTILAVSVNEEISKWEEDKPWYSVLMTNGKFRHLNNFFFD